VNSYEISVVKIDKTKSNLIKETLRDKTRRETFQKETQTQNGSIRFKKMCDKNVTRGFKLAVRASTLFQGSSFFGRPRASFCVSFATNGCFKLKHISS
jgi:competence transcription factor ComK